MLPPPDEPPPDEPPEADAEAEAEAEAESVAVSVTVAVTVAVSVAVAVAVAVSVPALSVVVLASVVVESVVPESVPVEEVLTVVSVPALVVASSSETTTQAPRASTVSRGRIRWETTVMSSGSVDGSNTDVKNAEIPRQSATDT